MGLWYENELGMADYLPDCLNRELLFQELCKGVDRGMDDLKEYAQEILKNGYLMTADESILTRYETIFSLVTTGMSLDYRRNRIASQFRQRPPIHLARLKGMMYGVLGEIVKVEEGQEAYSLIIKYKEQTGYEDEESGKELLRRLVPANIALQVLYAYVEWQEVKIASWGAVGSGTWQELMEEGV